MKGNCYMKKLFLCFVSVVLILFGPCQVNEEHEMSIVIDADDLNSYEIEVLAYESSYLKSNSGEDLKILCSELSVLRIEHPGFYQMILRYYPVLFENYNADQVSDISDTGLDSFYALYVCAQFVKGNRDDFEKLYYMYKEKAENHYYYANWVYSKILIIDGLKDDLQIEGLSDKEYEFLNNEGYVLYEQAKRDDVDIVSRIDSFYCIKVILQEMGKDDEVAIIDAEIQEFWENSEYTQLPDTVENN